MSKSKTVWCISILTLLTVSLLLVLDTAYSQRGGTTVTAVTRSAWLDFGRVKLLLNNCERMATLVDGELQAGEYAVVFNASHLSSGVYAYRLSTENSTLAKQMVLVK